MSADSTCRIAVKLPTGRELALVKRVLAASAWPLEIVFESGRLTFKTYEGSFLGPPVTQREPAEGSWSQPAGRSWSCEVPGDLLLEMFGKGGALELQAGLHDELWRIQVNGVALPTRSGCVDNPEDVDPPPEHHLQPAGGDLAWAGADLVQDRPGPWGWLDGLWIRASDVGWLAVDGAPEGSGLIDGPHLGSDTGEWLVDQCPTVCWTRRGSLWARARWDRVPPAFHAVSSWREDLQPEQLYNADEVTNEARKAVRDLCRVRLPWAPIGRGQIGQLYATPVNPQVWAVAEVAA